MKQILFFILISIPGITASAQKKYDLIKDFGAVPDDRTDCYAAMQKAAQTISKAGGGILNIPKGKYYIGKYKISGGKNANGVLDITFRGCHGLVIKGNGSRFRVNGKFIRNSDYKSAPYMFSYSSTVSPFVISNCTNVLVEDLGLDGDVQDMRRDPVVVEGACSGILIDDYKIDAYQSSNITLSNIKVDNFAADGIMIRSNGTGINIINCTAKCNARQGLSIVGGKNIVVDHCIFDSTGFTGEYGRHPPSAGIDLENESGPGLLKNIVIKNCSLRSNRGFQIVTTLPTEDVRIDSCFIADLSYGRNDGLNGVGMFSLNSSLTNSIIFGTVMIDIADQLYTGPVVQRYTKNIIYSAWRGVLSSDFARPCNISDNMIIMLPSPIAGQYFPYIQNRNCIFSDNIIMINAGFTLNPGGINGLIQYVKESKRNVLLTNGYSAKEKTEEKYFGLDFTGAVSVGNQYFAPGYKAKYPAANNILLNAETVNTVEAFSVFTSFNQKSFNERYLLQADEVRKILQSKVK